MTSNDYKEMELSNRKNKMWVYLSKFSFLISQSHLFILESHYMIEEKSSNVYKVLK